QRRQRRGDLLADAVRAARGVHRAAPQGEQFAVVGPDAELQLGAADLDAEIAGRHPSALPGRPRPIRRCRSSTTQWNAARWTVSTMPMSSSGTCRHCWAIDRSLPPPKPVQPNVLTPLALAHSTARRMLGLLPEPEIATRMSPGLARFLSCSTKTRSKPSSLPQARM